MTCQIAVEASRLQTSIRSLCTATALALLLSGCTAPRDTSNDEQIKQNAANATRQLKQDGKIVGNELKKDTKDAARVISDAAAGVKEGLKQDSSNSDHPGQLNINTATSSDLAQLPGINARRASAIVRNRPYDQPEDLVTKGVIDRTEYNRISSRIYAQ